jgi:hypothetical protein
VFSTRRSTESPHLLSVFHRPLGVIKMLPGSLAICSRSGGPKQKRWLGIDDGVCGILYRAKSRTGIEWGAQTVSNANASTMQGLIAIDTARIFAGGIRTSEKASADFLG